MYHTGNFIAMSGDFDVIYLQESAVQYFIARILPTRSEPFVLVTGDCDETLPDRKWSSVSLSAILVWCIGFPRTWRSNIPR